MFALLLLLLLLALRCNHWNIIVKKTKHYQIDTIYSVD